MKNSRILILEEEICSIVEKYQMVILENKHLEKNSHQEKSNGPPPLQNKLDEFESDLNIMKSELENERYVF